MTAAEDSTEPLVTVAHAVKTRGLRGEIVAELLTDFPERFENLEKLVAVSPAGKRQQVGLESFWFQKDRVVLKLSEFDDIDAASSLIGYDFAVPEAESVSLPENHYYDWQLEGCAVYSVEGNEIGIASRIVRTGAVEILAVTTRAGHEVLIPLAEPIVVRVDTANKLIVVDPPEGLLEL